VTYVRLKKPGLFVASLSAQDLPQPSRTTRKAARIHESQALWLSRNSVLRGMAAG